MSSEIILTEDIKSKIFTIRGVQVMLDKDLAELYGVETRALNQAVKRNIDRFPIDFMFRLTGAELKMLQNKQDVLLEQFNLKSQNVISSTHGGLRKLPYVFTEQGVAGLSGVLKSRTASKVHVEIMRAFVIMRRFLVENASVFQRFDRIELKQLESDQKFEQIFKALESKKLAHTQGIFFDGQIFDAYQFVSDLIRSAEKSIILIDNYLDDSVLTILNKRNKGVKAQIYTEKIKEDFKLDLQKYNAQYENIDVIIFKKSHDRFLIIDEKIVYHLGASLKDLGKKWFAFSKMETPILELLEKI